MNGKIISFVPFLKNGVQDTYEGKNGILYKFTITWLLDNNTQLIGQANSKSTTPSWKTNIPLTFDDKPTEYNGNTYHNFSNIKDPTQQNNFGGGGKKEPNPEFGIQKAFEAALECTLKFFELNPDIYSQKAEDSVLDKMWVYMLNGSDSRRWINMSAMRLTLQKMQANGHTFREPKDQKISDWLFNTATLIANNMEVTVKNQVEIDKANKSARTT